MHKIVIKNKPILYHNENFQTLIIRVYFPFKVLDENLAKIALLPTVLNYMNSTYPTEEEFSIAKQDKYILSTDCFTGGLGEDGVFYFQMIIPDRQSLGKDILEEEIQFFHDFIYSPLIINDGFSEFELEREKKNLKMSIDNSLKNLRPYQSINIKKHIDTEGILSRTLAEHVELIDKVTPKNLYQFYKETITNNQPVIYIFGNTNDCNINELAQKYLYNKEYHNKDYFVRKDYFLKPRDEIVEITEKSIFKDSSLSLVYKVKDMKNKDIVYLILINNLLSSLSSRLLGKKLRTEKELIYSSNVLTYNHFGVLEITVFLKKEHVDEAKSAIKEVIDSLKDEELIEPLLKNVLEKRRIELLKNEDYKFALFQDFIIHNLGVNYTSLELYEMMKEITAKDISIFINRLKLDTIYFIEEGENE